MIGKIIDIFNGFFLLSLGDGIVSPAGHRAICGPAGVVKCNSQQIDGLELEEIDTWNQKSSASIRPAAALWLNGLTKGACQSTTWIDWEWTGTDADH